MMNKKIGCIGNPPHIGHTSIVDTGAAIIEHSQLSRMLEMSPPFDTNRLEDSTSYIKYAPFELEPFVITLNPHQYVEPWIDQNDKMPNYKKHLETCAKNRKKRKSRKR
jgi:hypothetical protein